VPENYIRKLKVYRHYFWEFHNGQSIAVKDKIDYVIAFVRTEQQIPKNFFEHVEGSNGLFEIRVKVGNNIFRIFSCFDKGQLIILFNGFQKKSQKTPKNELKKALELQKQYYAEKQAGYFD
jgi:phage-related protein